MQRPSYDELASLVAGLIARVEALELENSALKRKLGTDSTNSSTPPSQDSLAAKGKRRTQRSGAGAVEGTGNAVGRRDVRGLV